jgi:AcrR family transcriptional regulator
MARPRTDIRPRLLHAARARFLSDGVDGASLRAIARDAGTSIAMLLYHFPTRDELFLEIVEEVYAGLLVDLTAALAPGRPVGVRLGALYQRLARISDDELAVLRLVVREVLVGAPRVARLIERFQRGHLPLVLGALLDGLASGELDRRLPLPLLLLVTFAVGALPQLVRRAAPDLPPFANLPPAAEMATLQLEVLLGGIGARPAAPTPTARGRRPRSSAPRGGRRPGRRPRRSAASRTTR